MMTDTEAAQHTPGPWLRKSSPGDLFGLCTAAGESILYIHNGVMPTLEDACLISAAPDLLTACKAALDAFDMDAQVPLDILIAAVAKAEGREL